MLCLDSYVIMDLLSGDEKKAAKAAAYIQEIKSKGGIISSAALIEGFFHIARRSNLDKAHEAISFIESIENLKIADVNKEISLMAGNIRAKYYSNTRAISFMACIHVATAISEKCSRFITGDRDFEDIEEIDVEVY